ncbi:MAG TPA: hypothetical protein VJ755_02105 [Gemmatimonadales bacterium]|nr:hypothetical protein [Gemmatimonadales bacterium]
MADKERDRDWDREMREVDKLLAKLPEADPTLGRGLPTARSAQGGSPTVRTTGGTRSVAATWGRLGLGLLLGVGMLVWPYSHVCGAKLLFYGTGVFTLIVSGIWSATASWRYRQGFAHLMSILLIFWGVILALGIVLPRTGYADAAERGVWFCPEPTTQSPPKP